MSKKGWILNLLPAILIITVIYLVTTTSFWLFSLPSIDDPTLKGFIAIVVGIAFFVIMTFYLRVWSREW